MSHSLLLALLRVDVVASWDEFEENVSCVRMWDASLASRVPCTSKKTFTDSRIGYEVPSLRLCGGIGSEPAGRGDHVDPRRLCL